MFDIGGGELLLILIVVLVAFGPKKLPELAQSLGRGIREFKRAQRDFADQINSAIEQEHRKQTRTVSRPPSPQIPGSAMPELEERNMGTEPVINASTPDQIPQPVEQEPRISPPVGEQIARGTAPAPATPPGGEQPS